MNDFYNKLQSYNLSPVKLKKDLEVNVDESAWTATKPTASYDLRNGTKVKNSLTKTKFETLTFVHFFPKLLLAFQHDRFISLYGKTHSKPT